MALTKEKSEELALHLELIKVHANQIDLEYAREVVRSFRDQASRQESLAVLNPLHPQAENDRLYTQAQALEKFLEFVELLKRADELKQTAATERRMRENIQRLFI